MSIIVRMLAFGVLAACAAVQAQTWNIGMMADSANVTATLSEGTMTISGTGSMANFNNNFSPPWKSSFDAENYSITKLIIENGVTSIGIGAFRNCRGLNEVTIGNSVAAIDGSPFTGCTGLTSIEVASDNANLSSENGVVFNKNKTTLILYPQGKQGAYTVPNSVNTIRGGAFSECAGLTEITIPNSVTTIGWGAFARCTGLTEITIPNGVTTIENYTFSGCTGLTQVTIPNSVTTIGEEAFRECSGLLTINYNAANVTGTGTFTSSPFFNAGTSGEGINVNIGNNVTNIPNNLFFVTAAANRPNITSINFQTESKVQTIGSSAFQGLTGLTEITIPSSVTTIGSKAFEGCTNLRTINYNAANVTNTLETGLNHWLYNAGTSGEVTVNIGDSGTSTNIPKDLFNISNIAAGHRPNITSINLLNSVTTIGNNAFAGCTNLRTINYNAANITNTLGTGANHWLHNAGRGGEVTVNIGDNVIDIPNSLFHIAIAANRPNITNVNFGTASKVETFGHSAFRDLTGITSITIPGSMISIGENAFSGCTGLDSVISLNPVPPTLGSNVFWSVNTTTACLYVPQNSIADYSAASQWDDFSCINAEVISIASRNRRIPDPAKPDATDSSSIAPINIIAAEFTAGPNPVSKHAVKVDFFRMGSRIETTELSIFDASGNFIKKITITETPRKGGTVFIEAQANLPPVTAWPPAVVSTARRVVGSWDLTDSKNRPVSEGTYVVRGTITTRDGKKERISLIIGVR